MPDGDPPRRPTPTPTLTPPAGPAIAVLDAGAESDGALSVWRALNAKGLRVVLRPAAYERRGVVVLAERGRRVGLARRIAREAELRLRIVGPGAMLAAGAPPDADVVVLVGRRA